MQIELQAPEIETAITKYIALMIDLTGKDVEIKMKSGHKAGHTATVTITQAPDSTTPNKDIPDSTPAVNASVDLGI